MTVYVDDLKDSNQLLNQGWKYPMYCHLAADSIGELHEFARKIGLKEYWFQSASTIPHYDLTESKRKEAVKAGAVPLQDFAFIRKLRRKH